jgi:hypothetical protein
MLGRSAALAHGKTLKSVLQAAGNAANYFGFLVFAVSPEWGSLGTKMQEIWHTAAGIDANRYKINP